MSKPPGYKVAPWTGDDFTFGHRLRDAQLPKFPIDAEKTVEFVIIGGGIGGLTSAYFLKDHDFLLLEQYDQLGGQSRGDFHNGIGYSYGAAYIGYIDGLMGDLLSDLQLKPVQIDNNSKNSWWWQNKWTPGIEGQSGATLYSEFKKLTADARPLWDRFYGNNPTIPLQNADLIKLDNTPFHECMKGYSPAFLSLMDSLCKSSACAGINQLSALAGYSLLEDLVLPSYVFEGGNPAIARGLISKLRESGPERCTTGAFVWQVQVTENGASVVYSRKDGSVHRIKCRHVILATPPLVAGRQLTNVPVMDRANLLGFRYGSYLVANLILKKRIFNGAYDNWVAPPFLFADITIAETPYMVSGKYKPEMGSVLTIYQPYPPASEGRPLLLAGDRQSLAKSTVQQMKKLLPDIEPQIEKIVLSRWGHAMAVTGPGYFGKMSKVSRAQTGNYSLAHCSTQGLPCAESAVQAARYAADRALKRRAPGQPLLPRPASTEDSEAERLDKK